VFHGEPGQWARFAPDAAGSPAEGPPAQGSGSPQGDRVRILLADDDPQVLAITARILNRQSWEVVTAASGQEAIESWPVGGEPFDLIILDVNMPAMNGYEAFRELRRLHPGARILFISGYAEVPTWRRLVEEGGQPFLAKPYSPRQLVDAVRSLIEQGNDGGR